MLREEILCTGCMAEMMNHYDRFGNDDHTLGAAHKVFKCEYSSTMSDSLH